MSYENLQEKVYRALLTQTGTNAPTVASVVNNFAPVTVTAARSLAGIYTFTFSSAVLTANKTIVLLSNPLATLVSYFAVVTSTTVITLHTSLSANVATVLTGVATDALLTNTMIKIIVVD